MKRVISAVVLFLLIVSLFVSFLPARAAETGEEIIYIRADGSIEPPYSPIVSLDNVTYSLTDDFSGSVVVERNNIVVDGGGHALRGSGTGNGVTSSGGQNVTLTNLNIEAFDIGILLYGPCYNRVQGNNVSANDWEGISLIGGHHNTISRNNVTGNGLHGIKLWGTCHSIVSLNSVTGSGQYGIKLWSATNNSVSRNQVTANEYGIKVITAIGNQIFHNSFVGNVQPASSDSESVNAWDAGYPSGGNYWSTYTGADQCRGLHQNISGADGIGDVPFVINGSEQDNYPLMGPFSSSVAVGLHVTVFQDPAVGLIFDNVTSAGTVAVAETPTGPPPCMSDYLLVGSAYNVTVTAGFAGDVLVRIVYDDSNMTPEQEASLRLIQWDIILGDVNSDGRVNWRDLWAILASWGSYPGHRRWNPSCDLNNDGEVNRVDFCLALQHYGERTQCQDITTYLDIESNLILGVASHFSIFGVTRAH